MSKFSVVMLTDVNQWPHAGLLFWYFASVFVQSVQVAGTGGPAPRSASAATMAPATPSMAPASAFPAGSERIALTVCLNAFILHFFILLSFLRIFTTYCLSQFSFTSLASVVFMTHTHPRTDCLLRVLFYIMPLDLRYCWPKIIRRALSYHTIGNWCVPFYYLNCSE